jgi:hypothetical protein
LVSTQIGEGSSGIEITEVVVNGGSCRVVLEKGKWRRGSGGEVVVKWWGSSGEVVGKWR